MTHITKNDGITQKVIVTGMGMSISDLTSAHLERIEKADILIGGKRHLSLFDHLSVEKKVIDRNLNALVEYIREHFQNKQIVVLASGDPLFFGIGKKLTNALGANHIVFYPNINSVAAAFSKLKMPWQNAKVISLHGRGNRNDILENIQLHPQVAIFTSPEHTPSRIAQYLMDMKQRPLEFWVFERMGHSDENFDRYELNQAGAKTFAEPNLVVCISDVELQKTLQPVSCDLHLGMPDHFYSHEKNMITKSEVRVVSISRLMLQPDHVLWDLGAGCGSIAIESSLFIKTGRIIAVEKNPHRIDQIKQNQLRFKVDRLEIIQAVLPDGISDLPAPDRIFIGGGGEDLAEIMIRSAKRLKSEGIMVLNIVLLESLTTAYHMLNQLNFEVNVCQIQVSTSKRMPSGMRMSAQNPVWIVVGRKV
jgi:precorrin-6Y C5,15-methyltransferase (decarboxylating)